MWLRSGLPRLVSRGRQWSRRTPFRPGVRPAGLLDVQWSELDTYSVHYADDEDVNWRFDRHPNTHSPGKHVYPRPDASTSAAVASCLDVEEIS